ncbi:dihydrofolate reductase family protein [Treponema zuelzerae]|uniref:Dihydrofolate reductase family protein n=1 Tax=Teretinema zuelzerae TaxID=156 RepID=A0AAE3EFP3_9SPIR|nr:dihydrofolate reductase family protein [Teretinema zuelzerae]MCD1653557.1 dihydrofolate reductase family protein [Teretinema zuelzerae]
MLTQYYTASTLDGFIATTDHSLDWLFPLADISTTSYPSFYNEVGAIVMGASTYEWILQKGMMIGTPDETEWPYNMPCWVLSHQQHVIPQGADIRITQGDVRNAYNEAFKISGDRNLWIVGGGDIAGQFFDAGLLDELIIQIGSVTLGNGIKVFPREILFPRLKLISCEKFSESMVELRYKVSNFE